MALSTSLAQSSSLKLFSPLSSATPLHSFSSQLIMATRAFTRQDLALNSSNCKTRVIACMSTNTSSSSSSSSSSSLLGKEINDDEDELSGEQEEVNEVVSSWIDSLPREIQPYARLARLEKPIGTWLLLCPFAWSAMLAAEAGSLPDFKTLALYTCAAVFLRGAGSTINDVFDRDIDRMVGRTKTRPIASGAVTPFQGICFSAFQFFLSHGILLQLPNYSAIYEASFIFLASTYPFMKRLINWPSAYLGLACNTGALFGWYAIKGSLEPSIVLPLAMAGVLWTVFADIIYSNQDKDFDEKFGVKSAALTVGDSAKQWMSGLAIACIASFALTGYNASIGWPYYAFLASASGNLAWQIVNTDLSSPTDCSRRAVTNIWFGTIIFGGILLGRFFP